MGMYNDIVMKHFMKPHNAGQMENPDAVGSFGSPVCGDLMEISIKVKDGIITDAMFMTFGCGSAIASSSIATEMIKGMSLEEALKVTNGDVVDALGGLPAPKVHCSVLAEQAIKNAIYNYAQANGLELEGLKDYDPNEKDPHGEAGEGCGCHA